MIEPGKFSEVCQKNIYVNKDSARFAAAYQVINTLNAPEVLWVYFCHMCRGYHLTKQTQHGKKAFMVARA